MSKAPAFCALLVVLLLGSPTFTFAWTVDWIARDVTPYLFFSGTPFGLDEKGESSSSSSSPYFLMWDKANNTFSQISSDDGSTLRVSRTLPSDWNERTSWMPAFDYYSDTKNSKLENIVGGTRPYIGDKTAFLIDLDLVNASTAPGAFPSTVLAGQYGNWDCLDETSPYYFTTIAGDANTIATLDIKVPKPFGSCSSSNVQQSVKGFSLKRSTGGGSEDPVLWEWILGKGEKASAIAQAVIPGVGPTFVSISSAPGQSSSGRLDFLHIVALRADSKTGEPGTPVQDCGSVNITNFTTGTAFFTAFSIPEARSSLILLRQQYSGRLIAFDINTCSIAWERNMPGGRFQIVTPSPPSYQSPSGGNNNDDFSFIVNTQTNYTLKQGKQVANAAIYSVFRLSTGELLLRTEEVPFTDEQEKRVNDDGVAISLATIVTGPPSLVAAVNQKLYLWLLSPSGSSPTPPLSSAPLDKCLTTSPNLMPLLLSVAQPQTNFKIIIGGRTASKDGCIVALSPSSGPDGPTPIPPQPTTPTPAASTMMIKECQKLDCTLCTSVETTLGCVGAGSQAVTFLRKCNADGTRLTIETFADRISSSSRCGLDGSKPIDINEYQANTCYPDGVTETSFSFERCNN